MHRMWYMQVRGPHLQPCKALPLRRPKQAALPLLLPLALARQGGQGPQQGGAGPQRELRGVGGAQLLHGLHEKSVGGGQGGGGSVQPLRRWGEE